jgi:hypothetical protein
MEKQIIGLNIFWTFPYNVVKYIFYTYYDELKTSVARNLYAHYAEYMVWKLG